MSLAFSPVTRIERLPCPTCTVDVLAAVCFIGRGKSRARASCPWCGVELAVAHLEPERVA